MHPEVVTTSPLTRRGLLTLAGGSLAAAAVSGCGHSSTKPPVGATRHHYGRLRDQFGDLYLPAGAAKGTVVVLHGGYWSDQYGLDLMVPISTSLQRDGWAVWNLEYRRLGSGGGWPATFEDAAAGVDHLTALGDVDLDRVIQLGHSAGGQLAVWAASRTARTPGGSPTVRSRGVVSLSGVLELARGSEQGLGGGAVDQLMGGSPAQVPDRYRLGDPVALLPASAPVACVRGTRDAVVPATQSTGYVRAARETGVEATYTKVTGDHFTLIDPTSSSWATTVRLLDGFAGG